MVLLVGALAVGVVCGLLATSLGDRAAGTDAGTERGAGPSSTTAPAVPDAEDPPAAGDAEPWRASFPDDGLVTNERAHREAGEDGVVRSPDWVVTSGSLFASGGAGTTGDVDGGSPDATSSGDTGSAVLRAVTRRSFGDVRVDLDVRVEDVVTTERTPARDYDGVHLFVRYSDAFELYSVDLCRRDGTVTIKRKTPAGDAEEGGDYVTLAEGEARCPVGSWESFSVTVRDTEAGVRLELAVDGRTVLTADDTDRDGVAALRGQGAVGVRGDNTRFSFRDLVVRPA